MHVYYVYIFMSQYIGYIYYTLICVYDILVVIWLFIYHM